MSLSTQTQEIQKTIKENKGPQTIENIGNFYQSLIDCIKEHNHQYYNLSDSFISDQEYDELFAYLRKIEEQYPYLISSTSPTQSLQDQLEVQTEFQKAKHLFPMISLENSYNTDDIIERTERAEKILLKEEEELQKVNFILEPKFDGISIELIYKNGNFSQAITRGDGKQGEDVTENAKTITSIPKKLLGDFPQGKISFRGEILISKTKLNEINQEREAQGLKIYANTRNLASGSMKQLDPNITAQRELIAYMYEAYGFTNTHNLYTLQDFGFNQDLKKLSLFQDRNYTKPEILEKVEYFSGPEQQKIIHSSDIEFDGLVVKVKDGNQRKILGSTAHHPRRAIAYKFPAQQVATQIKSIDFQVGRTGIITPVANLQPVQLSGATLSRVSLHNFDFIKEKDIHHNDWVRLQRSGEVIPYIVGVITDRREKTAQKIFPPSACPSCNQELTQEDMHYFCRNSSCSAQLEQKLIWFVSKNAMNIEGIGESIAKILVEQKIVQNVFDIYKLLDQETIFTVRRFPGFADKKITEIQKQLEKSKKIQLWRLINALGINGIGKKLAQDIQNYIEQLPEYTNTWEYIATQLQNRELVADIYGIGDKIIDNIVHYFQNHAELLHNIKELNFEIIPFFDKRGNGENGINGNTSKDISFSITGSFPIPRPKIIKKLETLGYKFHTSPKKTTDVMLIGEKAGSKKEKAEELGIEILDNRDKIVEKFPELENIKQQEITRQEKIKKQTIGPVQGGLFG